MEDITEVRYFKFGGTLMRYIWTADGALYEDLYSAVAGWKPTNALSGPYFKGDTDLIELTEAEARLFAPQAFEE